MIIEGSVFGGFFKVDKKLGAGAFGAIFTGTDLRSRQQIALKLESSNTQFPQLKNEARVYQRLIGVPGIAKMLWFGSQNGYNVLVLELLGLDMETIRIENGGKLSLKEVIKVGDQMFALAQSFHKNGFVHRDIKPENFLTNQQFSTESIHLIDFGLSKSYIDQQTKSHVKYTDKHQLIGTARYASINTLFGCDQSRRDDLESIFYVVCYLLNGALPWQGIRAASDQDKCDKIRDMKQSFQQSEMFQHLPKEFKQILEYIRKLSFSEQPDYAMIRNLLRDCSIKNGYSSIKDWPALPTKKRSIQTTLFNARPKKLKDLKEKPHSTGCIATRSLANVPFVPSQKNLLINTRKSTINLPDFRMIQTGLLDIRQGLIVCPNWHEAK